MKKTIATEHVRIGMRIVELDVNWLESPFWRRAFTVKTEEELIKLNRACKQVVIDVEASARHSLTHFRSTPVEPAKARKKADQTDKQTSGKAQQNEKDALKNRKGLIAAPELLNRKELQIIESNIAVCVREVKDLFTRVNDRNRVSFKKLTDAVHCLMDDALNDAASLLLLSRLKEKEQSLAEKSVNVCILTIAFAQYLDLDQHTIYLLGMAALLHDIGMLKVPSYLLSYEGKLNRAQRQAIEYHVIEGMSFVGLHNELSTLPQLKEIIGNHHERYDGSGYPRGIKGENIPYLAQVLGITSTYEAMTRERFYSDAANPTQALSRIYSWRAKLFDSRLVTRFIKALGVYPPGCMVELMNGRMAVVTMINPENRTRPVIRVLKSSDQLSADGSIELDLMAPEYAHISITRTLDETNLQDLEKLANST
ncbi:HD-GYP domain-containing protein [Oceanospirillum sp.]|uniref:HD-GYP domain-containing protein n=1 Tax=Oceanospirillum sp. TaxID=2021254 RepID=UPI003A9196D7